MPVLTPDEARAAIDEAMPEFDSEPVSLAEAAGRVLRQPVNAERDQPPFDRVTMDGIAISYPQFAGGSRRFPISSTQHAGDRMQPLASGEHCAEVMTGAVLPEGADTVIPVERIRVTDGVAELEDDYAPDAGQFVHRQGSDHHRGVSVLHPGMRLTSLEIAILASCGLASVDVTRRPGVRVISTGNELVPAGEPIEAHQIRMSNGPALVAMLAAGGFADSQHDHLPDEPQRLEKRIAEHLATADILVLSGGVSMGKADHVPAVLSTLGVKKVFHRISQRPGKPMWFGIGPNDQAVFALPGNPVSSLVCCRQYVLPALFAASRRESRPTDYAVLGEAVNFKPALTFFLPVTVSGSPNGQRLAAPVATNTSGDFTALGGTDGYVELDAGKQAFAAGQAVPYHPWNAA